RTQKARARWSIATCAEKNANLDHTCSAVSGWKLQTEELLLLDASKRQNVTGFQPQPDPASILFQTQERPPELRRGRGWQAGTRRCPFPRRSRLPSGLTMHRSRRGSLAALREIEMTSARRIPAPEKKSTRYAWQE